MPSPSQFSFLLLDDDLLQGPRTHFYFVVLDNGEGADALALGGIAILQSDVGYGLDMLALVVDLALVDAAYGSDIQALALSLQDAGAGVETIALHLLLADAGLGSDRITDRVIGLIDSGHGVELLIAPFHPALSDSGVGQDRVSVGLALADSGAGVDLAALWKFAVDSGAGVDALAMEVQLVNQDSGLGSELVALAASTVASEQGNGLDAVQLAAILSLFDSGLGADAVAAIWRRLYDAGEGGEAVVVMPRASDSGSGVESVSLAADLVLPEVAEGLDAFLPIGLFVQDAGAGIEAAIQTFGFLAQDSGAGSDSLALNVALALIENGAGQEVLSLANLVALLDSGSGGDNMALVVLMSDGGTGIDVWTVPIVSVGVTAGPRAWALRAPTRATTLTMPDRTQSKR